MLLQLSHTSGGIIPAFINIAKALQPKQIANADSRKAAVANIIKRTTAAVHSPERVSRKAHRENAAPIPWAKRFGGPGTGRSANGRRGVRTLVTNCPSGLSFGPVSTRAPKP